MTLVISACDCGGSGGLIRVHGDLVIVPPALDFGRVPVGTSDVVSLELSNKGSAAVKISSSAIDGKDFVFSSEPPSIIEPGASIAVSIAFAPMAVGAASGTLFITADDPAKQHTVALTGFGTQPGIAVELSGPSCGATPDSLSFGSSPIGQPSDQTIVLKSTGTATVTIASISFGGMSASEFTAVMPPIGLSVAPGVTAPILVRFTPAQLGEADAELAVVTDAPDGTIRVPVCGEGIAAALCADPVPLDLGNVALGKTATGTIHLTNCGTSMVTLSNVKIATDASHLSSPGFALTTSWPSTLAPGTGFDAEITFQPSTAGLANAFLEVDSNGAQPVSDFPIRATGVGNCDLSVAPSVLDFVGVSPGSTSALRALVSNNSMVACVIDQLAIAPATGPFSMVTPPAIPAMLASGATQVLTVRYAPTHATSTMDVATLDVGAGVSTQQVHLVGTTQAPTGCHLQASPNVLNFGVVSAGTQKTISTSLSNVSSASCDITAVSLSMSSPGFANPTQALGPIAPGASVIISVTYSSFGSGQATGTLVIQSNDQSTPSLDIPLSATTPAPGVCVNPTLLSYGMVSGSKDLSFDISACGGRSVTITGLPWSMPDPEFSLVAPPSLPFLLAAGAQQAITVRYRPSTTAPVTAVLDVASNDSVTPSVPVTLKGGGEIVSMDAGVGDAAASPDAASNPDAGIVVPPTAGRYLYSFTGANSLLSPVGEIDKVAIPSGPRTSYWGLSTTKPCSGCHAVSPDGHYVAFTEFVATMGHNTTFRLSVVDLTTGAQQALSFTATALFVSWNPNINTTPPYQFAFDDGRVVWIASVTGGLLRSLSGANSTSFLQRMPSWGPNGKIAFVRGTQVAANSNGLGFAGTTDIMIVNDNGSSTTPTPLSGASGNGMLNFYPAYSPDGRWIAFTTSASGTSYVAADARLRLADAGNSGFVSMLPGANGSTGGSFPTWSLDGSILSFSSPPARGGAGDWDIWYVPFTSATGADGPATNLAPANTAAFDHVARWSP
jgi:hypothetical protein